MLTTKKMRQNLLYQSEQSYYVVYKIHQQQDYISQIIIIMLGKSPLWKNIGKEGSLRSPESSLSSAGRPVKVFHIMFQEEGEPSAKNKASLDLKNTSSIPEELEGSPMMIITQEDQRKNNEQVLEVISFGSYQNERVLNMDHVLKSMGEISEREREDKSNTFPPLNSFSLFPKIQHATQRMAVVASHVHQLKKQMQVYKFQLKNVLSQWYVQTIGNLKVVKQRIQNSSTKDETNKFEALQQQVAMLGRNLALQREEREIKHRQNSQLQEKLRRLQRAHSQQRMKIGSDLSQVEQLRSRTKRMQPQLSETKMQIEEQTVKTTKLRELIKERQARIIAMNEENSQLQKRIRQLKSALEEASSRERRQELDVKTLRQRLQIDREGCQKECGRAKGESTKLKGLLKVSQEQLSQCEDYINKLNNQIKEQQAEIGKLHDKVRANESQYCKKLRQCDQYLIELQARVKEMDTVHIKTQHKMDSRERQLSLINEQLKNKAIELRSKEGEMDDMRQQYQHKLMSLSRRQDGMKAEYRMAIDSQHAAKDKWYQRYYKMLSPEKQRNNQPICLTTRSQFTRKDPPERDVRPPLREALFKVKSERNLNINQRIDVPSMSSARSDFERNQSQRDLAGLGSRIISLRRELTRQLGQMGIKP